MLAQRSSCSHCRSSCRVCSCIRICTSMSPPCVQDRISGILDDRSDDVQTHYRLILDPKMNHLGSHRRTDYDREVVRIVVVAVALALLPAAQPRTTLHVFSPWAGSIPARGVTIDRYLRGACTHGSEVLTRADAWHCHVGRKAYDPCFSNSRGQAGAHVLCLNSPWEDAIAIELIKPLPFGLANPAGVPTRF